MKRAYRKGSFTIEAAILAPFVLFLMTTVMQYGISFYQKSVQREVLDVLKNWDAVSRFYEIQLIKEAGEEIKDD